MTNTTQTRILIFLGALFFVAIGLLIVYDVSVAESLTIYGDKFFVVRQQVVRAVIGIVALIIASKVPSSWWKKIGPLAFGASLLLLVAVLIPGISDNVSGARRWIALGPFPFQPSEIAKLGLIFYLSSWLQKPRRFLSFLLLLGLVFGLIMLEPDLGSGLVMSAIGLGMYFAAGKPLKHFLWLLSAGFIGITLLILISPYRLQRLTTFINPDSDPQGKSYHIRQITIALGNGGVFGQGLGKSRQKYQYIPEAMTDSIFAIVAEEIGFAGCAVIVFGYIFWLSRGQALVAEIEDPQEHLIGVGVTTWLVAQTLVNLGSVVALIPLTGVPLPFISYGGSSLIMNLASVGVLLSLHKQKKQRR